MTFRSRYAGEDHNIIFNITAAADQTYTWLVQQRRAQTSLLADSKSSQYPALPGAQHGQHEGMTERGTSRFFGQRRD